MTTGLTAERISPDHRSALVEKLPATTFGRCHSLRGENFSGRSRILRQVTGITNAHSASAKSHRTAYVPPELSLSVSGLQPTVEEEILFHLGDSAFSPAIRGLLETTNLDRLLERNPTTLSGGELALLVLIAKLALRPDILALDCALEQVAPEMKAKVLDFATDNSAFPTNLVIADNRLSELPRRGGSLFDAIDFGTDHIDEPLNLAPLESDFSPSAPLHAPAIELREVSFSYTSRQSVLRNVNLSLKPGTVYLLHGRNGAGKSTLARILCGVLRPTSGSITADGRAVDLYRTPGRIVNYVYQDPDVQFVADTVLGDLRLSAEIDPDRPVQQRIDDALRIFGLGGVRDQEIADLPFVIRKRASLSGALVALKPWIILDEPTLGQDDSTVEALAKIIDSLRRAGYGIIVITHSAHMARLLEGVDLRLTDGELDYTGDLR